MKILVSFFILIILVFALFFPTLSLAQETENSTSSATINSFELFWPISAGKIMGEQMYTLKILKEDIREFFIFSNLKKAEYNVTLSEKRVVESEKLFMIKKDYVNGKKTLDVTKQKQEKAITLLKKEGGKNDYATQVKSRIIKSFTNQKDLLVSIALQVPPEQGKILEENANRINSLLKSLE